MIRLCTGCIGQSDVILFKMKRYMLQIKAQQSATCTNTYKTVNKMIKMDFYFKKD